MRPPGRIATSILGALLGLGAVQDVPKDPPKDEPEKAASRLSMSTAVACVRVDGFENFVPLDPPRLTSEDKLKVYFRPLDYKVEPVKARYRAKFTEDGRVRRKGEKTALSKEDKLLEYEAVFDSPTYQIFLTNTIGLKNLPPGDYEFEIILHDALVEGSTATQTLSFQIIPTPKVAPAPDAEGAGQSEDKPVPIPKKATKKGATPKTSKTKPQ